MRHRRALYWVAVAICGLIAAGCGSSSHAASSPSPTTSATTGSATTSPATGSASSVATAGAPVPGLTASTITVGDVSTESGPVPGLFSGAPYGVSAYFAYINSQGGVDGRKLVQKVSDDGFECSGNANGVTGLSSQVLAFVGSMSEDDGCGANVINKTIPAIYADQINTATEHLPNGFSPIPVQTGFQTGPLNYLAQTQPAAVRSVGVLYSSAAASDYHGQKNAMVHSGWTVTYERGLGPSETQFTPDILRMKAAGVKLLWLNMTATVEADIVDQANQQGWHPLVVFYNGYSHTLLKLASPAALEGLVNFAPSSLFLGEDETVIPADATFLQWMTKTQPAFTPDLFSLFGWEAADLFVEGLKAAGPNPTRASVMAALKSIHSFTANGLSAPADVGNDRPPICWLESTIHDGKWQRVKPASGFDCQPAGYLNYTGS